MMNSNSTSLHYQLALAEAERERRKRQRRTAPPALMLHPHQQPPPGDWRTWLLMAGRGAGKTQAGAAWLLAHCQPGQYLGIVAPTFADARDTCVEGPAGILKTAERMGRALTAYNRSMGEVVIGGARIKLYSGDQPDRLRGPQHHALWFDELAAFRYGETAFDMAMLGLRLGDDPRVLVTTTPRPTPLMRRLLTDPRTTVVRASTYANREYLAPAFFAQIIARYEGTRLGRQELDAELLEDTEGALWKRAWIEPQRVTAAPSFTRVVVSIDPSATSTGDEAGVITAALGTDGHAYVLSDDSVQAAPEQWAAAAVTAYHKYHADCLLAEQNNGGEMVRVTISTITGAPPVKLVHASRGKATRAEPVSMLYQQGKVHHVGAFPKLEDELCSWVVGDNSPNRLDALVWALTELMLGTSEGIFF
ncbi:MAG TPA: terminase family protein [Roseiflexaceae bacterium]|nr:terminase family protein [Roseiflexaceae bacterium]